MTYREEKFFCKPMGEASFLKLKKALFSYGFKAMISPVLKRGLKEVREDHNYSEPLSSRGLLFNEDYPWEKSFDPETCKESVLHLSPLRERSFYRARWGEEKVLKKMGIKACVLENSDEFLFLCSKQKLENSFSFYIRSLSGQKDKLFWSRILDLCPRRKIFFAKDQISPTIGTWSERVIFKLLSL